MMTPVARAYLLIAFLFMPLSLLWLLLSMDEISLTWAAAGSAPLQLVLFLLLLVWTVVGAREYFFSTSNLRRNYPVLANLRYLLESFRPEIRQYFISNDLDERPFSRERRDIVYSRAKDMTDTIPFGTKRNLLEDGYRSLQHSLRPTHLEECDCRVQFGGRQCEQPYNASRLNISAMSFGALSANAVMALNKGAELGGFAHNTGEGSISPHHTKHNGDLIWQIGTGYFGCRQRSGRFDSEAFAERANLDQVKMIELKLSQGAKPSHGGVLPGAKVSEEIAEIRLVEVGRTVLSPPRHPEFDTPAGLLEFVQRLRELSGGKPVGFKLALGKPSEFSAIVKAMLQTGILPDFITVDGAEGGTGAAPVEFTNRLGVPCLEATYFVSQILLGADLKNDVRVISSGITATGFDMLEKIALGADTVNAARSMMLALGCIQARACNTNRCPTGVTTQDKALARAINVEDKAKRVYRFQRATVEAFLKLCGAMGLNSPDELEPEHLFIRRDDGVHTYADVNCSLLPGQLLADGEGPQRFRREWDSASPDSF
ncbi:MAG: FMN-binding glutamate synthase family protein [Gammaproteobacteria bacterium]|nr:FMN-binding glutamate synthase family protein [Gammaproteobacteria bacterium]